MPVTLNGTTFYPSDVPKTLTKVGKSLVSVNGTRTWIHRGHKRSWELSWNTVSNTVRGQVQTIALLTSTFTFVDQLSVSYTVQCEADCYQESVAFISRDGTLYYDLTLTIYEA